MARKTPDLGEEVVTQIEAAWKQLQPDWARQRLVAGPSRTKASA